MHVCKEFLWRLCQKTHYMSRLYLYSNEEEYFIDSTGGLRTIFCRKHKRKLEQ